MHDPFLVAGASKCRPGPVLRTAAARPTLLLHPLLILTLMRNQLTLIEQRTADWRLDERTKQLGIQGVAAARAALEEAARRSMAQASRTPAA